MKTIVARKEIGNPLHKLWDFSARSSYRILIPMASMALLGVLWGGIIVQGNYERETTLAAATERNDNLAVALEQFTFRTIQGADTITRYVKLEAERSGPDAALASLRESGVISEGLYQGVGIIDEHGFLSATTMATSTRNFADREHFYVHRSKDDGNAFIGKPVQSKNLNEPTIAVTRRLNNPDGSFNGVVAVQINPKRFTEIYKSAKLEGDDFISIAGLDGIIRARRVGQTEQFGEDYSGAKLFRERIDHPNGQYISRGYFDGTKRLLSYRTLKDYPLVVSVGVSEADTLAEVDQRQNYYWLTASLISILVAVFSFFLIVALSRKDRAVEQLRERESQLKRLATHDPLTKLPNRALLNDRAAQALTRAVRTKTGVACLFLDLDNFKYHNDAKGHLVGDGILKEVARQLSDLVRSTDTVARLGGDEFVVLLADVDDAQSCAAEVAQKILQRFSRPITVEKSEITVTTSIGISVAPSDGLTLQDLLRHADAAMYRAKEGGRGKFEFYSGEMGQKAGERVFMEEELRRAIRSEQFELHYQPQFDIRSGRPVGVEALIRWRHPDLGLVSPGEFIPIAEDSGLILQIGEWVLRTACAQNKAWQQAGLPRLPVAVNFSALQFRQPRVVDLVSKILGETGLDACDLELELTETMIVGKPETVAKVLHALKGLGLSLALDDFGTGYSNLQYLMQFPIDALKVDRSFISNVAEGAEGLAIAKAIVSMGNSLGLRVIAEGIETPEQAATLAEFGCPHGQGYHFCRPLPADECFERLKAGFGHSALAA